MSPLLGCQVLAGGVDAHEEIDDLAQVALDLDSWELRRQELVSLRIVQVGPVPPRKWLGLVEDPLDPKFVLFLPQRPLSHEKEYRLKALFAVDHVIDRRPTLSDLAVQVNRRERYVVEDRIDE